MLNFKFKHVRLESFSTYFGPHEVTSAELEDRLGELYKKLEIPHGTLEKLTGIKSRYFFNGNVMPSAIATGAANLALERMGIAREHIQMLVNCSVSRDFFEPATACIVHRNLALPETTTALDISNACIGFSNGLNLVANLIETGVIKAGLVVTGENVARLLDSCMRALQDDPQINREKLLQVLPTFTLGCGGAAFVLCHESIATRSHKLVGSASRTASEFNDLCNGNADFCHSQTVGFQPVMYTESSKLIASAAKLGGRTWKDFSKSMGWSKQDVNHIFCHQVGRQVNEAFYQEMELDMEKEFTIYRKYGNMVSAAMPAALVLGADEIGFKQGDKILTTAFGSGLNCIFSGFEW